MPGLVNAHGPRAAMVLLRGLAEDMPFDRWLRERIWPIEARWMSPDFAADRRRARAARDAEVRHDPCFSDMRTSIPRYRPPAVAQDAGMRAQIAFPLIEFPNAWSSSAAEEVPQGTRAARRAPRRLRCSASRSARTSAYALGKADLLQER